MAIITSSSKLSAKRNEFCIQSKRIVFFRLIDEERYFRLMTATASEDTGRVHVFPNQEQLIASMCSVAIQFDIAVIEKRDHAGRLYVEAKIATDKERVEHIANTVLLQLGFEDGATIALSEMKALYEEFAVDDTGGDVYLEGGVNLTEDGRLVER